MVEILKRQGRKMPNALFSMDGKHARCKGMVGNIVGNNVGTHVSIVSKLCVHLTWIPNCVCI